MELDPQNHTKDGLLGPNSIRVVYMNPLGMAPFARAPCEASIETQQTLNSKP